MATPGQIVDHNGLSREQIDLIERFAADFNAVEQYLHVALAIEEHETFTQLVLNYAKNHVGSPTISRRTTSRHPFVAAANLARANLRSENIDFSLSDLSMTTLSGCRIV